MKIKIPAWKCVTEIVEVFEITEWKNNMVYKTKKLGFSKTSDIRFDDRHKYIKASFNADTIINNIDKEIEIDLIN